METKLKVKVAQSYPILCDPMDYTVQGILQARIPGVGSRSLLQQIFPTQGSNPGLLNCRRILYQLSHQGSPRILERVVIPSPADPPNPGIEPGSPELQADSLPAELSGKPSVSINLTNSEKAMAPHSSTLAWKIPWTEETGRLQSMGSLRVGHD